MVIDTLENLKEYVGINPLFQSVIDFLAANDLNSLAEGKHPIVGSDVFVNITTVKGCSPEAAVMEVHRRMTDIQIPISGSETYGYTTLKDLPEADYNDVKDVAKISGLKASSYVTCSKGMFAIFTPQDGHAPGISAEPCLKKAIFKVKA